MSSTELGACWGSSQLPLLSEPRPGARPVEDDTAVGRTGHRETSRFSFFFDASFVFRLISGCVRLETLADEEWVVVDLVGPEFVQQNGELTCDGHDGSLLGDLSAALGNP